MPRGRKPTPLAERLWARVDRSGGPDACWPWTGQIDKHGYGMIRAGSAVDCSRRWERVHRLVSELEHGPIPKGSEVDHTCHNGAVERSECAGGPTCPHRRCCNPRHLRSVPGWINQAASSLTLTGGHRRRAGRLF